MIFIIIIREFLKFQIQTSFYTCFFVFGILFLSLLSANLFDSRSFSFNESIFASPTIVTFYNVFLYQVIVVKLHAF